MLGRPNRWFINLLIVTFRVKITVTFRVRSAIVLVMVTFYLGRVGLVLLNIVKHDSYLSMLISQSNSPKHQ